MAFGRSLGKTCREMETAVAAEVGSNGEESSRAGRFVNRSSVDDRARVPPMRR
jgi:hypothetical protein